MVYKVVTKKKLRVKFRAFKERVANRILIIESEPLLRSQLTGALGDAGFSTAEVSDLPEALLKLEAFNPDIIIMGEVLSSGDGIEACRQLRNTLDIPIILLGGQSGGETWKRVVGVGANIYLKKPFSNRLLVALVGSIVRRYKLRAQRMEKKPREVKIDYGIY